MKKSTLLLIIIITFLYSCQKNELNDNLIFSGKIENPNSDTLKIIDKNQSIIKSIILNKNNTFRDTLNLSKGFYSLKNGEESTQIYLKPKYDLSLTLNTKEFDESIKYEGNVGFPKNRTVINSNLLTLNSNCHNEKQQI